MTVRSDITHIYAPKGREFKRDEAFEIEVGINATGEGTDRLLIALYDNLLHRWIGAWATDPLPPNEYTINGAFNPLDEWYPTPIPGILDWTAIVGYVRDNTGTATDSERFKMPRIVDRVCISDGGEFCVGVSNPYPAPGEEIAITGHYKNSTQEPSDFILATDGMQVDTVKGRKISDWFYPEQVFTFWLNAPRFEGGYTYWVWHMFSKSPPIGIWVTAPPACEEYATKEECEAAGCLWYDYACHSAPPIRCEDILIKDECTAAGCYWWDGRCHSYPQPWWEKYKKELMLLGGMGAGMVGIMVVGKMTKPKELIMEKSKQKRG